MVKIRKYKKGDLIVCANLIRSTYADFCVVGSDKKASKVYMDMYDVERDCEVVEKIMKGSFIFFVAVEDDRILALVRGKSDRITGLFVDKKYHNRGIGKLLVKRFEKEAIKNGAKKIKIRSSLYGVPFYQKLGFKKTTGIRNLRGLVVQPMQKKYE